MPNFKPKTSKKIKICRKYTTTLDGKHKEFVNEFIKNENEIIPQLKNEKNELLLKLQKNKKMNIENVMEIKDRIIEIDNLIKELIYKKNEYYLSNSKYIFEYFENKKNIENLKNDETNNNTNNNIYQKSKELINNEITKTITTTTISSINNQNNINFSSKNQKLFNLFKINNNNINNNINNNNNNNNINNNIINENLNKNIVQKYLTNIDISFLDINNYIKQTDICEYCYKGELIPYDDEGILICNNCGVNIPYLIENEKPSYKEPPKEVCFYAYKKINHFKEILAQFQGKETTQIPDIVIEQIKLQIEKERINYSHLNHNKTKEILKKLGFNKYYEHIAFIKNKLGIKPPVFSNELEETLCNLFLEIQAPYAKVCPNNRVNFLNYYYVLYKFCELLNEEKYLNDIPLLKDREKLIEQDDIWKQICIELNWEFLPTV